MDPFERIKKTDADRLRKARADLAEIEVQLTLAKARAHRLSTQRRKASLAVRRCEANMRTSAHVGSAS